MPETEPKLAPHEYAEAMLRQAVTEAASDLYLIPDRETVTVRLKVGGVLRKLAEVPRDYGLPCITRIKVLAGMLTYRSTVAQDGAIRGLPELPGVELRVAALPTHLGERLSIRIIGQSRLTLTLDDLGYEPAVLAALRQLLARGSGLLVLTGPTGSGKTTTMYAMVRELLRCGTDPATIITIEDPVELELDGVSQVQITRGGDEWSSAQALRAVLRHDVKTIVIGEMRDADVVRVALDAALTGHRVITSFHAGDIANVYGRILHQGFEPFLVAAAVTGVVSQRLMARCDGRGEMPVTALLQVTDPWRDFVATGPTLCELRARLAAIPGADLPAVAAALAARQIIAEKDVHLL